MLYLLNNFLREIMAKKTLYRVSFMSQGQVYEIYANSVEQGMLFGFIEIEELVLGGESETVEFKPTLRYDLYQKIVNKKMEYIIAKTIAAFMNCNGGNLLIGVDDNMNSLVLTLLTPYLGLCYQVHLFDNIYQLTP